jgi:hypothetical protein
VDVKIALDGAGPVAAAEKDSQADDGEDDLAAAIGERRRVQRQPRLTT